MFQVSAAAGIVGQSLSDLLQHVRQYASRGEPIGRYDQATDTIMTVTESIFSSMGDAGESPCSSETYTVGPCWTETLYLYRGYVRDIIIICYLGVE